MRAVRISIGAATLAALFLFGGNAPAEESDTGNSQSESGLDFYCQGGIVVEGIAYFTSTDGSRRKGVRKLDDFPSIVSFNLDDFRKLRTYPFHRLYDSSPLLIQKKDGTWLLIAHEYKKTRTVALNRDSGQVEWISPANQPGAMFFGYTYFKCKDGTKIILAPCANGLHALSAETGKELWWLEQPPTGGVTPCVDQDKGWVFYQCSRTLLKIKLPGGEILKSVAVDKPNYCISWNTVLVNDSHGYFVATRWYGAKEWDSALRVFDKDLSLVWEKTGLPIGKKDTLTYVDGKLVSGSGNGWSKKYEGDKWKYIAAYAISSGEILWKCDLSKFQYVDVLNVPYYGGYFYAETQDSPPLTSKVFRINASNGKLEEVFDYGRAITSCATCIIARGKILSGDLWEDRAVVTKIAEDSRVDWPGPFCDPQTNHNAAPDDATAKLVPMRELGR